MKKKINIIIYLSIFVSLLLLVGYLFITPAFVREQEYIENSKRILLSNAGSIYSGHSSGIGHTYRYHIVRDNFGGKYYVLIYSGKGKNIHESSLISYIPENTRLVLTVNRLEADNPEYGTPEKPIPAFLFMREDDLLITEEEYRNGVKSYLAFGKDMEFCTTKAEAEKKESRKTIILSVMIFVGAPATFFVIARNNNKIRTGFLKKLKSQPNDKRSRE